MLNALSYPRLPRTAIAPPLNALSRSNEQSRTVLSVGAHKVRRHEPTEANRKRSTHRRPNASSAPPNSLKPSTNTPPDRMHPERIQGTARVSRATLTSVADKIDASHFQRAVHCHAGKERVVRARQQHVSALLRRSLRKAKIRTRSDQLETG